MKRLSAIVFGFVALGLTGFAADDKKDNDNAKKIVGKWEITKAGGGAPVGTLIEFTKDGKLHVEVKIDEKVEKVSGTYKVEKEKVHVKLMFGSESIEESLTIKKLTNEDLEWEDKDNKVDVLKKKK